MLKSPLLRLSTLALMISAGQASAYELYATDDSHLNATLEAVFGVFHSQENYALSGRLDEGSSSWREGYIKYGLSFDQGLAGVGTAYGAANMLSSGTWGFIIPKPGAPELLGLSPVIWLILAGGCVLTGFLGWERRRLGRNQDVVVDPAMLDNKLLRGGLVSFFFQYLLQAGLFFVVPLFLSVALGLSAIETGVQLLPLSVTLLLAAVGSRRPRDLVWVALAIFTVESIRHRRRQLRMAAEAVAV